MIPNNIKTIIDLTLGDGWIGFRDNNRNNPYYICEHGEKQIEYAKYKENLLNECGYITHGKEYLSKNEKVFGYKYYRFYTEENKDFKTVYKYIYNKKRKAIDKHLLRNLDERSLAFWYMDDGSTKLIKYNLGKYEKFIYEEPVVNCYRYCLDRYTEEENNLFSNWLLERFNIESKVIRHGNYFRTAIYRQEAKDIFRNLVDKYFVDCLKYKLNYKHSFNGVPFTKVIRNCAVEETERNSSSLEDEATVQA
jgi:hypothetical protein